MTSNSLPPYIQSKVDCLVLLLHVQPGARKAEIQGLHGGRVKIKVQSPPLEGRANEEVVELLSRTLRVPEGSLELISGQRSRQKSVSVRGVSEVELVRRLALE